LGFWVWVKGLRGFFWVLKFKGPENEKGKGKKGKNRKTVFKVLRGFRGF